MSDVRGTERESSESVGQRFRENAVGIVSTLVTAVWMGALFTSQDWWLAALIVGYAAVVPITAMLFGDEEEAEEAMDGSWDYWRGRPKREEDDEEEETALEALRRRYAEGELSEEQFERKLETLLETETIEDVEDRTRQRAEEREHERA
jgi:uncharacterized membrane protein